MLCESVPAAAQGQYLAMEVENSSGVSAGQGQAGHGTSRGCQDRQRETSFNFLFHTEALLVTLPLPRNCALPPSLWITWESSKTNTVTSYRICRRREAAALGSEQSHAPQWDYYPLGLERAIEVEP